MTMTCKSAIEGFGPMSVTDNVLTLFFLLWKHSVPAHKFTDKGLFE